MVASTYARSNSTEVDRAELSSPISPFSGKVQTRSGNNLSGLLFYFYQLSCLAYPANSSVLRLPARPHLALRGDDILT